MTRTLTLATAILALAAPAFAQPADIVARHAAETGERQTVHFIADGGFDGSYTTFGTSGSPSVSALEVALRHAEENNEAQRAKQLRARIAEAQDGVATATASTKQSPRISAAEVALRHAEEADSRQLARFLRTQIGQ